MHKYLSLMLSNFIIVHAYAMETELTSHKQSQDPLIIQQFKQLRDDVRENEKIIYDNLFNAISNGEKTLTTTKDRQAIVTSVQQIRNAYIEPVKPQYLCGSIIIREDLSLQDKKGYIRYYLKIGIQPHQEERDLAYLEWWERIPFNTMIIMQCAAIKNQTMFSILPHDIISLIALYMAQTTESLL